MENQENTSTATEAGAESTAAQESAVRFAPGTVGMKKKFNFKQRTVKDETGKEVDKLPKQPSLEVMLPVPTAEAIIAVLSQPDTLTETLADGTVKEIPNLQKQLILDYINQIIFDQAKSQLDATIDSFGADKTKQISVSDLDYDKLSLAYIASIPPARRGAVAISDEEWKEFFTDYGNVMMQGAGKTKVQIENHIKILEKPRNYRAKKDLLGVMRDQLNLYAQLAANLEEFIQPYQRLQDQIGRFIEEEDKIDITAL